MRRARQAVELYVRFPWPDFEVSAPGPSPALRKLSLQYIDNHNLLWLAGPCTTDITLHDVSINPAEALSMIASCPQLAKLRIANLWISDVDLAVDSVANLPPHDLRGRSLQELELYFERSDIIYRDPAIWFARECVPAAMLHARYVSVLLDE